jgi:hypothetical protein
LQIHPGCTYIIQNMQDEVRGIFIAPEIGDIIQRDVLEVALAPIPRDKKKTLRGSMNMSGMSCEGESNAGSEDGLPRTASPPGTTNGRRNSDLQYEEEMAAIREAEAAAKTTADSFDAFQKKKPPLSLEQKARLNAMRGYEAAMCKIGHKLLASGLDMGLVGEICTEPEDKAKQEAQKASKQVDSVGSPLQNSPEGKLGLRALADEPSSPALPRLNLDPVAQEGSLLHNSDDQRYGNLCKCHKIHERMEADARRPPEPPQSIIKNGGHLLLCIVSSASSETNTEVAVGDFGPPMGIAHFITPLREKSVGHAHPVLVVLAEELPRDWHAVAEDDNIYFVCGSALSVVDLDRAGFRGANAIAINRCHQPAGKSGKNAKIADARAILATTIIEAQFKDRPPPPVITDLAYDASVEFLPQSHAMMLAMSHIKARPPKRAGGGASDFLDLPSLTDGKSQTKADEVVAAKGLGETSYEEDYEVLETPDYAEHPRFMCGMVFVASAMTALVANTMHNHSLISLVSSLLEAPFLLLHVPYVWQGQSYADLCEWLMKHRNLLALGIYRNSQAAAEETKSADSKKPSLYYVFTAPPAYKTVVNRSDRILVITPGN